MEEAFDSKSVYEENYQKTKVKSYNGKINTDFMEKNAPKRFLWHVFVSNSDVIE